MTNWGVPTQWSVRGVVAKDWMDMAAALDAFADGTRRDLKHFRAETLLFCGNIYTVEFRPAGESNGRAGDTGQGSGMAGSQAGAPQPDGGYPTVRVSVSTSDGASCHPARDVWSRFIGTLSRWLGRVTGRFDAARRQAIGAGRPFESCEQGMERYVRRKLGGCVTWRQPTYDVEAVFSDRGLRD